jgi:hypothetical protein
MDATGSTAVMPVTDIGKGTSVTAVTPVTQNGKATKTRLSERYTAANFEAARVLLENPARYGGESAGLVRWARLFVSQVEAPPADWEAGPLFAAARAA